MVKTHTFDGKKHRIYIGPVEGICFQSDQKEKDYEIFLLSPLKEKNGLITALHEALHASDFNMKEEKVERISKEIGRFLWRIGYRWRPKGSNKM